MFTEKWKPVYAIDSEGSPDPGVGGGDQGGAPPPEVTTPVVEPHDGPGSGRSQLRKQLEQGFEEDRKGQRTDRNQKGRFTGKRVAEEYVEGSEEPEAGAEGEQQEQQQQIPPPEAFSKEAKAEWAKTPPNVQAAVIKREQDVAKGVEQLKQSYAPIENAIRPHLARLQQVGKTPAEAIERLFAWMGALETAPAQAFPALAQSFGIDIRAFGAQPQQQAGQQQQQEQTRPEFEGLPQQTQQYIKGLEQYISQFQNSTTGEVASLKQELQRQVMAKTTDNLMLWAKDKPHFEEVRTMMAHLLHSGQVPPLPGNQADLDKAYDMALYALPEVRQKVLADQAAKADAERKAKQDAEKKAQQEQAEKARRTASSVNGGAPGAPGEGKQKPKGKSVRESLMSTIEDLRQ